MKSSDNFFAPNGPVKKRRRITEASKKEECLNKLRCLFADDTEEELTIKRVLGSTQTIRDSANYFPEIGIEGYSLKSNKFIFTLSSSELFHNWLMKGNIDVSNFSTFTDEGDENAYASNSLSLVSFLAMERFDSHENQEEAEPIIEDKDLINILLDLNYEAKLGNGYVMELGFSNGYDANKTHQRIINWKEFENYQVNRVKSTLQINSETPSLNLNQCITKLQSVFPDIEIKFILNKETVKNFTDRISETYPNLAYFTFKQIPEKMMDFILHIRFKQEEKLQSPYRDSYHLKQDRIVKLLEREEQQNLECILSQNELLFIGEFWHDQCRNIFLQQKDFIAKIKDIFDDYSKTIELINIQVVYPLLNDEYHQFITNYPKEPMNINITRIPKCHLDTIALDNFFKEQEIELPVVPSEDIFAPFSQDDLVSQFYGDQTLTNSSSLVINHRPTLFSFNQAEPDEAPAPDSNNNPQPP